MKTVIIGGGINGLCSAYYLKKAGSEVTVVDHTFSTSGTSFGNAGMIVPSHFVPLAAPGVIAKGIRWMFDAKSPFYIRPRLDLNLLQWLWMFYRSCTQENVLKHQHLIWQYNEYSKNLYKQIELEEELDSDFHERGLMMLYRNEYARKEEEELAVKAMNLGIEAQILDAGGVAAMNPGLEVDILGGVFFPGDAHLYSNVFMHNIRKVLDQQGVRFLAKKVSDFECTPGRIKKVIFEDTTQEDVDEVVIASGTWSGLLLKKLGVKLILEDGKGYSITMYDQTIRPYIPSILTDEKVAVTPMGNDLRITGTLEISGRKPTVNKKRLAGFLDAVPKYFPQIKPDPYPEDDQIWTGYRPLPPDGIPYLGRVESFKNLVIATGHGMMGMSLGPATGELVSRIVSGSELPFDINLMRPDRFKG